MAKRGVDLGHLKGTDDSLDRSIADKDENALIVAANPLVTEAADPPRLSTATAHPAPEPRGGAPLQSQLGIRGVSMSPMRGAYDCAPLAALHRF